MASIPITSWQIEGRSVEVVTDFLFLGSKNQCGWFLQPWNQKIKAMTNLDSSLKSRDITLLTKVRIAKAVVFPVVTYGCESWTIRKTEHQRIDAFERWWRFLQVPWTARSNQSILREINPEYLLEGQGLKLKLQYFGHLMQTGEGSGNPLQYSCLENPRDGGAWRAAIYGVSQSRTRLMRLSNSSSSWLTGKVPDAGKDWGQKKRASEDEMPGCITKARGMNLGKLQEMVRDGVTCHVAVHGVTKSQTWLNDSTTTKSEKSNNRRWLGKCWLVSLYYAKVTDHLPDRTTNLNIKQQLRGLEDAHEIFMSPSQYYTLFPFSL